MKNAQPGSTGHVFTLDDFRLAFLGAGVLTLLSIWGYAQMARDAGQNVGGGSRRQRAQGAKSR